MAIRERRGQQIDFNPDKMLPGEWAVSLDQKYIYMCFSPGDVRRMSTYEEMVQNIQGATEEVAALFTAEVQAAILEAMQSAADADLAAQAANTVAADLIQKRDSGYFTGPPGKDGADGKDGKDGQLTITQLDPGMFGLTVNEAGHLILTHNDNEPAPPLEIVDGRLLYKIN